MSAEALCLFPAIISTSAVPQSPMVPAAASRYHLSSIVPSVLILADCQKPPSFCVVYRSDVLTVPAAGGYVPLTSNALQAPSVLASALDYHLRPPSSPPRGLTLSDCHKNTLFILVCRPASDILAGGCVPLTSNALQAPTVPSSALDHHLRPHSRPPKSLALSDCHTNPLVCVVCHPAPDLLTDPALAYYDMRLFI